MPARSMHSCRSLSQQTSPACRAITTGGGFHESAAALLVRQYLGDSEDATSPSTPTAGGAFRRKASRGSGNFDNLAQYLVRSSLSCCGALEAACGPSLRGCAVACSCGMRRRAPSKSRSDAIRTSRTCGGAPLESLARRRCSSYAGHAPAGLLAAEACHLRAVTESKARGWPAGMLRATATCRRKRLPARPASCCISTSTRRSS